MTVYNYDYNDVAEADFEDESTRAYYYYAFESAAWYVYFGANTDGTSSSFSVRISSSYTVPGVVSSASLTFRIKRVPLSNIKLRIFGAKAASPVFPVQGADDVANYENIWMTRVKTTTYADWDILSSFTEDEYYTTPDLSDIIEEIKTAAGWTADDSVVFYFEPVTSPPSNAEGRLYSLFDLTIDVVNLDTDTEENPSASDAVVLQDMYPVHEDNPSVSDAVILNDYRISVEENISLSDTSVLFDYRFSPEENTEIADTVFLAKELFLNIDESISISEEPVIEKQRIFTSDHIQLIRIDDTPAISSSNWTGGEQQDTSGIADTVNLHIGNPKIDTAENAGVSDTAVLYKLTKPGSDGTEDGSGIIEEPEYEASVKYFIPGQLELKAVPEAGNAFILWELNGLAYSGETPEDFDGTVQDGDTVTAIFKQNYTYPAPPAPAQGLTVTISPAGSGKVYTRRGLCTDTGATVTLDAGENVLFAVTDSRNTYEFSAWTGDVVSSDNPVQGTMPGISAVTALFVKKQYAVNVTVSPFSESGTVSGGNVTVNAGDTVTLTASPSENHDFHMWSGDIEGNENPLTITVTESLNIEAVFFIRESWLVPRLTEIKRAVTRWAQLAESIERYWETLFDPAINALGRLRSFFSASLDGKKKLLSELSGHYFETAFNPDDLPIYFTERRLELMRRGQTGAISSALQKINPDVPVVLEQMCVRKYDLQKNRQGFFYFPDEIADESDRVYIPRYALRLNGCILPFNSTDEWSALFRNMKPLYLAYGESDPLYTGEIHPKAPECDFYEAAQLFYTERFFGSDGAGVISCFENQAVPTVYFYLSEFSSGFQTIEMDIVYDTFGIESIECQSVMTGLTLETQKPTATYGATPGTINATINGTEKIILTCPGNISEGFDGKIFSMKPKMKPGKSGVLSIVRLVAVVSDKSKEYDIADGGFGFAGISGLGTENSADIIFISKKESDAEIIGKNIMDGFEPFDPENLFYYFSSKGHTTRLSLLQNYKKSKVYLRLDGNIPRYDYHEAHITLEESIYDFTGKTGVFYIHRKDETLRGYYADDIKLLLERTVPEEWEVE